MLEITIPDQTLWDEVNEKFIRTKKTQLQLEHSLISLSKWEEKWHKSFLKEEDKPPEELKDYIRCMTINKVEDLNIYEYLPNWAIIQILEYVKDPMTATTFSNLEEAAWNKKNRGTIITAEIIYWWMITLNIPIEFQKWHLNKLMTLIKVVSIKNSPKKKMSRKEAARQRKALNAARCAKYNTRG